jgi:hypothetical protein
MKQKTNKMIIKQDHFFGHNKCKKYTYGETKNEFTKITQRIYR